ncbi:Transcriptional_coactivator p15 domain-containing protein [Hexamita inflata]|uniref:Transcriptional coactivator p15 domain-containing protein n=1 Tax=Hexamita inflata TaxID=28002 RepID=A0AA86PI12_9EUKA|nr:Transcriptional coactivator p15 domain-containing protein [Hexamita inflata]
MDQSSSVPKKIRVKTLVKVPVETKRSERKTNNSPTQIYSKVQKDKKPTVAENLKQFKEDITGRKEEPKKKKQSVVGAIMKNEDGNKYFELEEDLRVSETVLGKSKYVDVRKYFGDKPSKKGITLNANQIDELRKIGQKLLERAKEAEKNQEELEGEGSE